VKNRTLRLRRQHIPEREEGRAGDNGPFLIRNLWILFLLVVIIRISLSASAASMRGKVSKTKKK
jgi:hypothetical protein